MRRLVVFAIMLSSLCGCAELLPFVSRVAQGAQWIGSLVDVAEAGSSAYFARHPQQTAERDVGAAVMRARSALAALNAATAAAKATDDGDVDAAKREAVAAYDALRTLLDDLGVLGAIPPDGGAETDAPDPRPVVLPTADAVANIM